MHASNVTAIIAVLCKEAYVIPEGLCYHNGTLSSSPSIFQLGYTVCTGVGSLAELFGSNAGPMMSMFACNQCGGFFFLEL